MQDINKLLGGTLLQQNVTGPVGSRSGTQAKKVEPALIICQCGSLDPKFRGYCRDCLTRLKATFDRYLEKFKQVSDEYEQYTGVDQKQADDKLRLMKNKIQQYEIKLSDNEIVDVLEKYQNLAQSSENRTFAEFKASVESLKQELIIVKARHVIELEDLGK